MKTLIRILFSFLLVTQICYSQLQLNEGSSKYHYSSIKDFNNSSNIDSLITTTMTTYHIPGLSACI